LLGDNAFDVQPRYDNQTDVLIRGGKTYAAQKRIKRADFLLPPTLDKYGNRILSKSAYYILPTEERPGGYLIDDVEEPKELAGVPSLCLDGVPVIITPQDAPDWLKPNQCFVVSDVSFEQLTGGLAFKQFASTAQLIAGLRNRSLEFGADVRVAIHSRVVQPFLDITLLFLGLPLVLTRENRNVFIAIGLCVCIVSIFVLVIMTFQQLGAGYLLDPALAAWAPLMIFVPMAVRMSHAMLD